MYCGMCCTCRCWFSNLTYFYTSLIAPLCIMLLFNLVTVFIVARSLHSKLSVSPDYTKVKLVRIIASLSLLVGATWSTGALLSFIDSVILQYAFAILNSLQGFLIFFVNILTSNEIRARIETSMKSSVLQSVRPTTTGTTSSVSGASANANSTATTLSMNKSRNSHNTDRKKNWFARKCRFFLGSQKYDIANTTSLNSNPCNQTVLCSRITALDIDSWEFPSPPSSPDALPCTAEFSSSTISNLIPLSKQDQPFEEMEMTGNALQNIGYGRESLISSESF